MKYIEYDDTRFIVGDVISYDVLDYPGIGHKLSIKVVSKKVFIPNTSVVHVLDQASGKNIRFLFNSGSAGYNLGVCVVFCFDYNRYFYLLYEASLYSQLGSYLENNIFSSDCLVLSGTFTAPKVNEEICPHLSYQEQTLYKADFPNAIGYKLQMIGEYNRNYVPIQKNTEKFATCFCGYISEYVEHYIGYKCPQCKIWENII